MEKGFFLIADISGYTEFLTKSELDHANQILQSVFESILKELKAPFIVSNFQGDAILSYAPESNVIIDQTVIHIIENIYFNFRNHLTNMEFNTTCQCKACSNIKNIDLKFFCHYGEFMIQKMGDKEELSGPDVILIHRLMKNNIVKETGFAAYSVFTEAAANELDLINYCDDYKVVEEEYEHIGKIKLYTLCMHTAYKRELRTNKKTLLVDPNNAWVNFHYEIDAPTTVVWDYCTRSDLKVEWLKMDNVSYTPVNSNIYENGGTYHCSHQAGDFVYEIVDWRPFSYITVQGMVFGKFPHLQTTIIKSKGDKTSYIIMMEPRAKNWLHRSWLNFKFRKLKPIFKQVYGDTHGNLNNYILDHIDSGKLIIT